MIARLMLLLRPTPREIVMLAKREVDPRYANEFEAIHVGPLISLLALSLIAVASGASAPFRIAYRLVTRRR
jgi:hypothetical protein